ncbi:NTP transferase domain-containing protein [Paenibacillus amylolyticus]|uniref:phosphocholine cytidylyltransferase family protein n=1 Tax=Paenibacillus amylolyticus TaxID=1451 RepID=UPI003D2D1FE7
MKLIILAAGVGSRLGAGIPKALVEIQSNRTILDQQIENFRDIVGINNIIIVVGFKKEDIMYRHRDLTYVFNSRYDKTNTAKSLLLGLEGIEGEDVIFINGDTFFDQQTAQDIGQCGRSSIMTNTEATSDEEVKYKLDIEGYISELSKEVVDAQGEAVGINFLKAEDLQKVREELSAVSDMDYFEKAIENLIRRGELKMSPLNVNDRFVKEIDFPEDLQMVRNHLEN